MQCAFKRKRRSSSEFDPEQQQSLFDTSVMKLHQDHLRQGVEPCLLRFVLINNALKLLQMHMLRLEEGDALGSLDYDGTSNRFFRNTFKHGHPSPPPLSPIATPVKNLKLESFGEQSPLVAATPFQSGDECPETGEGGGKGVSGCSGEEQRRPVNSLATVNKSCNSIHLGKHAADEESKNEVPPSKKLCGGSGCPGSTVNGISSEMLDHLPLVVAPEAVSNPPALDVTPSEDFAKVDPTIYDYDVPSSPTESSHSPQRLCTMQAIGTPVVKNGDTEHFQEGIPGTCSDTSPTVSNESEFLDDLDHIVNLLMT